MDWREAAAGGIPEDPSPGTPELRADIIDELADHLSCAMQRELRRTDDESAARKAVLDRFGNPVSIARQLWWDAVKERVMRDRIILGLVVLAIVTSLGASYVAVRAVQQSQAANEAILTTLVNATAPGSSASSHTDWAFVNVRTVKDEPGQPPLAGAVVEIRGRLFNANEESVHERTDSDGRVRLGPFRPGVHNVKTSISFGDSYHSPMRSITMYPGTEQELVFRCPVFSPQKGKLEIELVWPDERPGDVLLHILLSQEPVQTSDGLPWRGAIGPTVCVNAMGSTLVSSFSGTPADALNAENIAAPTELVPGTYSIMHVKAFLFDEDSSGSWRDVAMEPSLEDKVEIEPGGTTRLKLDDALKDLFPRIQRARERMAQQSPSKL